MSKNKYCYIFWTCASVEEAKKIIQELLQKRWIACASIFPKVISLFYWEGKMQEEEEVKVILKSTSQKYSDIEKFILNHASYDLPEILMMPIEKGNPDYLKWMEEVLYSV